jgi:hypothetical protein
VEGGATCGPRALGFEPGFNSDSGARCVFAAKFELAPSFEVAPGWATFCLTACRCASANGIAQTATSESRINALLRICALIDGLICFFMVLSLGFCENSLSQSAACTNSRAWWECRFKKNEKKCQYFFIIFFKIFLGGLATAVKRVVLNALANKCGFAGSHLRPWRFFWHRLRRSRSSLECAKVEHVILTGGTRCPQRVGRQMRLQRFHCQSSSGEAHPPQCCANGSITQGQSSALAHKPATTEFCRM